MIMREASSKRSRLSPISIWKWPYSMRERPRPRPSSTRPSERWSSSATFSATRSGSFQGTMMAPVPSRMRCVRPATQESSCRLSGQAE
jgi:hypothetical protein